MRTIEKAIAAVKAEIGRQLDAQPMPGPGDNQGDWWATGGSVDIEPCVRAVIKPLMEPGEAVRDMVEKGAAWKELKGMIYMAEKAGYQLNSAQVATVVRGLWQETLRAIIDEPSPGEQDSPDKHSQP